MRKLFLVLAICTLAVASMPRSAEAHPLYAGAVFAGYWGGYIVAVVYDEVFR